LLKSNILLKAELLKANRSPKGAERVKGRIGVYDEEYCGDFSTVGPRIWSVWLADAGRVTLGDEHRKG
jgi:hypothetical protein